MVLQFNYAGMRVYDAQANTYGIATGSTHHCKMEGCTGERISVKWTDGKTTFPCSKGLVSYGQHFKIG